MVRLALFPILLLLVTPGTLAGAADSGTVSEREFQKTIQKRVHYRYLLFLPAGYTNAKEKRVPLIPFLHGAPEQKGRPELHRDLEPMAYAVRRCMGNDEATRTVFPGGKREICRRVHSDPGPGQWFPRHSLPDQPVGQ